MSIKSLYIKIPISILVYLILSFIFSCSDNSICFIKNSNIIKSKSRLYKFSIEGKDGSLYRLKVLNDTARYIDLTKLNSDNYTIIGDDWRFLKKYKNLNLKEGVLYKLVNNSYGGAVDFEVEFMITEYESIYTKNICKQ